MEKNGLCIGEIDVPLPFPPRTVHVYLIKAEDAVVLIDLGPNTPATEESLKNGLKEHGLVLEDVTHVIFTHSHVDHAGFAGTFRKLNPDARIIIHEKELEYHNRRRLQRMETLAELFEAMDPSLFEIFQQMDEYYKEMRTHPHPTMGARFDDR